jgi:hypothetical protein
MEWFQVLTIVGVNITMVAALSALVIWTVTKHDAEIKSIANRLDGHAARIDQLYQMFVDLIKEGKK